MRQTWRALKSRNYRLFFLGQAVSLVGTWMQNVAMSWLVYRLTGSAALLGVTSFATLVPGFLLGPFAGVVVDRFDKRRVVMAAQVVMMLQAAALAALTLAGLIQVWQVVALSVLLGLAGAFDMPARQALMVDLVEDSRDLGNAIALNSSQFNLARLIGPAVGGFVVELAGEGVCFALNGTSFFAVLLGLAALRMGATERKPTAGKVVEQIRVGARYVFGFAPIRALILLMAVVSFLNGGQAVLMPVLAKHAFRGDAGTLGLMQAAIGAGALVSALALASRESVIGLGRWLFWSVGAFGASLALLALAGNLWLGLLLLAGVGAGAMTHMAATNTLLQTAVEDEMRGRVMSFYTMAFTGTMPFGSLLAGFLASRYGAPPVLLAYAAAALLAALVFLRSLPKLREAIRPVFIQKGILQPG